jgi:hypothetical protein
MTEGDVVMTLVVAVVAAWEWVTDVAQVGTMAGAIWTEVVSVAAGEEP